MGERWIVWPGKPKKHLALRVVWGQRPVSEQVKAVATDEEGVTDEWSEEGDRVRTAHLL